jgi:hypothetical protein
VVYIEGTRTKLGRPYQDPDTGKTMFPLRPSVRGTTDMAAGNIKAIARVETAAANPVKEYEFGMSGAPADTGMRRIVRASSLQEAQQIMRDAGWDTNKLWWTVRPKTMKGRRGQSLRPNPAKFRVMSSFGGVVVGWHNTLAAARKNAAAQSFQGPVDIWSSTGGQFGQGKVVAHYVDGKATSVKRNPGAGPLHYFLLHIYESASQRGKVSPQTLTRLLPSVADAKQWAQGEVTKYGGVGYLYRDTKAVATIHYKPPYIPRFARAQNPAGPSAIPTKWTKATVSRKGGQIQIRMGGR